MRPLLRKDISREEWDRVCESSTDAWLFHCSSWIDIESRYWVGEESSIGIIGSKGRLLALSPLYYSDARTGTGGEKLLHTGIHRHTGLACRDDISNEEAQAVRTIFMRRLLELAEEYDVDRIQLNCHSLAPKQRANSSQSIPYWCLDYGFQLGILFGPHGMLPAPGMSTVNADQLIDLTRSSEDIFSAFDESCRRAVRKSLRSDLSLIEGTGASCVADYYAIAQQSSERTGEGLPDIEYYQDIVSKFTSEGRCAVLFVTHNSHKVAAVILLMDKKSASFFAGVSDPNALHLRVNDFLHYAAINWCKENGLECYRLGPVFPEVPADWPIAKVSRFKGKFGGESRVIIQGSLFRNFERYASNGNEFLKLFVNRDENI